MGEGRTSDIWTHTHTLGNGLQVFCACSVMTFDVARTILSKIAGPRSVHLAGLALGLSVQGLQKEQC